MPARIIGMIGVTPPKQESTLLVIEGEISPSFIVEFAQAHEAAGFDMATLVGYSSMPGSRSGRRQRLCAPRWASRHLLLTSVEAGHLLSA
jgi:hypothetical protein